MCGLLGCEYIGRVVIIEQSEKIVVASKKTTSSESRKLNDRIAAHQKFTLPKLEDIKNFGHVAIYCFPDESLNIPVEVLSKFIQEHRFDFNETLRYYPTIEPFQNCISVGYYPKAIRQDIKSTVRITLYTDGFIAFDSQADFLMSNEAFLVATWLSYELQRHLQLSKTLLENYGVKKINIFMDFKFIDNFSLTFGGRSFFSPQSSKYQGSHKPITRRIKLSEINEFNKEKRNIISPIIEDIMDEVSRIFGFSKTLSDCWDENGYLTYVKGLENRR
ncbi:MAG: hypothetical protein ACM3SR_17515 [Ignavibacteriales bacterium]